MSTTTPAIAPKPAGKIFSRWSAEVLRFKLAELRTKLQEGKSDLGIAEEMTLTPNEYNALKREMYNADKIELHGKASEDVFIDYRLRIEGIISDLDKVFKASQEAKNHNASVGAAKAKADLIDRIKATGQEFGVLEKVPERKMVVAGALIAGMSNNDLRALVAKEVLGMKGILDKYGSEDILNARPGTTAADAALLPSASTSTVEAMPLTSPPKFTAKLKPSSATGGMSKVAGGKARAAAAKAEK